MPEGVAGGTDILVTTPDGQSLAVVVPLGLAAGDTFDVHYTPVAAAFTVILPEGYGPGDAIMVPRR